MQITAPFFFFSILGIREEKWRRSTAVAETIKPSSMRKHLAAGFILVRVGAMVVVGGLSLARQRRQHACLSECAITQSIPLGCQITSEWTAATSLSTPPPPCVSWCHCMCFTSRCVWNTRQEGEVRGPGEGHREPEREKAVVSVVCTPDDIFLLCRPSSHTREYRVH